jgi:hypothetical protein
MYTFILAEYSQWIESQERLDEYHGLAALNNCTVEIDTYLDAIVYKGVQSDLINLGQAIHHLEGSERFDEKTFLECLIPSCK